MDFEELTSSLASGTTLTAEQLGELARSRDLIGLGMLAGDARGRRHGTRGTFVRVEIVDLERALGNAPVDVPTAAGEVRLTGTPASLEQACAAVARVAADARVPLTGWALEDLASLAGSLETAATALMAAGLAAVSTARIDRLTGAQLHGLAAARLPLHTVTLGPPLDAEALLAALQQLRAWQADAPVVVGCSPLPVEVSADQPTTGYDDMRHVAVARLVLDNVPHIQADWTRMGAKLAQACLLFGADDLDGVPARDDLPHGPRRAILEEVRRNILAASLDPVERDGRFALREAR
ncbi:MAG: hypothetical protein ACR2LU_01055 [Luteitalea sp.]